MKWSRPRYDSLCSVDTVVLHHKAHCGYIPKRITYCLANIQHKWQWQFYALNRWELQFYKFHLYQDLNDVLTAIAYSLY